MTFYCNFWRARRNGGARAGKCFVQSRTVYMCAVHIRYHNTPVIVDSCKPEFTLHTRSLKLNSHGDGLSLSLCYVLLLACCMFMCLLEGCVILCYSPSSVICVFWTAFRPSYAVYLPMCTFSVIRFVFSFAW